MNPYLTEGKPSPVLFAKICFGWNAYPYQIEPLNDMSKRVLMACGRQVGKTEMAAIKGLYNAVMNNRTTTLIISPTQRQSGILFRRMKEFINLNSQMPKEVRLPLEEIIARETQTILEFENGSAIYSLPAAGDGSTLRGFTAHLLIVDEAGHIEDKVYSTITPMLSTTGGGLMLIGTPNGAGNFFHKAYSEPLFSFKTYSFPSSLNPKITPEFLKGQKESMPLFEYQQEFEAIFVEAAGAFFTLEEIDAIMTDDCPIRTHPIPEYEYILGYDPARMGDDSAVGIILEKRGKELFLVNAIELQKTTLVQQIDELKSLHAEWKFKKIVVDTTGVGGGITDVLVQAGLPIEEFVFSIKSKQDLFFHLKRIVEAKEIKIPKEMLKLRKQMAELRKEKSKNEEYVKIFHPDKYGHDDFCFIAGTPILTPNGQIPIEKLKIGDYVLTRKGAKKIIAKGNRIAPVIEKLGLIGTPDHPIITKRGIVKLMNVRANDITYIWNEKLSCIEERSISDTLIHQGGNLGYTIGRTLNGKKPHRLSIGRYGKIPMEKFQKGLSFITKTVTPSITQLSISNLCPDQIIKGCTPVLKKDVNYQEKVSKRTQYQNSKNGLKRQKVKNIAEKWAKRMLSSYGVKNMNINAISVKNNTLHTENSKQDIVVIHANKKSIGVKDKKIEYVDYAKRSLKRTDIVRQSPVLANVLPCIERGRKRVYNISVEDIPEYFANNILVHNCVALALAAWALKVNKEVPVLFSFGRALFR